MSKSYKEITTSISKNIRALRKSQPGALAGFSELAKEAMSPGSIDAKTKELIALAIGVSKRCDGCIGFHMKALKKLGATRQEIEEVLAINIYLGGGPELMYAADALQAYDDFF